MKTRFTFLIVALGLLSAQAVEVSNVVARQRWPWNNLVDIDFVVATNGTEATSTFQVAVTGTYANNAKSVVASTFATAPWAMAGTNRVTWNLGVDYPGLRTTDLTLTVTTAEQPSAYLMIDLSGGSAASTYPVTYTTQSPEVSGDACRTTELWLRCVPAGAAFTMGSPIGELGRVSDEAQVVVALTKTYYIGVFEVTQKQWEQVMGNRPSYYTNLLYRDTRPVEQVSYNTIRGSSIGTNWPASSTVDATSFIGKLRARTGIDTLDLPTEAQWEYACRAGKTTALYSGVNLSNTETDANVALLARYKYSSEVSNVTFMGQEVGITNGTITVGTLLPNSWGLYDMNGNVLEWCLDWYSTTLPGGTNPAGDASGSSGQRVRRGGSYDSPSSAQRSAWRWKQYPGNSAPTYGLRLAVTLP